MLGPIITKAREAIGLSQAGLAERLGVTQSHVSRIEDDLVGVSVKTVVTLAHVLDLDLGALVIAAEETAAARRQRHATDEPEAV